MNVIPWMHYTSRVKHNLCSNSIAFDVLPIIAWFLCLRNVVGIWSVLLLALDDWNEIDCQLWKPNKIQMYLVWLKKRNICFYYLLVFELLFFYLFSTLRTTNIFSIIMKFFRSKSFDIWYKNVSLRLCMEHTHCKKNSGRLHNE